MSALDAGGQAEDISMIASDFAREVGQIGQRGDDADFRGACWFSSERDERDHCQK